MSGAGYMRVGGVHQRPADHAASSATSLAVRTGSAVHPLLNNHPENPRPPLPRRRRPFSQGIYFERAGIVYWGASCGREVPSDSFTMRIERKGGGSGVGFVIGDGGIFTVCEDILGQLKEGLHADQKAVESHFLSTMRALPHLGEGAFTFFLYHENTLYGFNNGSNVVVLGATCQGIPCFSPLFLEKRASTCLFHKVMDGEEERSSTLPKGEVFLLMANGPELSSERVSSLFMEHRETTSTRFPAPFPEWLVGCLSDGERPAAAQMLSFPVGTKFSVFPPRPIEPFFKSKRPPPLFIS